MVSQGLGSGPLDGVEQLTGGTQNILVRFVRDDHSYVLRRPPVQNRGAVDGCAALGVDAPAYVHGPPGQHALGIAMVEALAVLARVMPEQIGLADIGHGSGWLERQVDRWRSQLTSYDRSDGYSADALGDVELIGYWRAACCPASWNPGLIHGDFHLGNVLFDRPEPSVLALVDWELAGVGDPLLNLGHMLATWPRWRMTGLPSDEQASARFGEQSGRAIRNLGWFRTLACFRMGVILDGTYARASSGHADPQIGRWCRSGAKAPMEQARQLIDQSDGGGRHGG